MTFKCCWRLHEVVIPFWTRALPFLRILIASLAWNYPAGSSTPDYQRLDTALPLFTVLMRYWACLQPVDRTLWPCYSYSWQKQTLLPSTPLWVWIRLLQAGTRNIKLVFLQTLTSSSPSPSSCCELSPNPPCTFWVATASSLSMRGWTCGRLLYRLPLVSG